MGSLSDEGFDTQKEWHQMDAKSSEEFMQMDTKDV